LGADIVGVAPISRWSEFKETKPSYFPQNIFPPTRSVIVLGIPIFIPMIDITPSIVYSELQNTTNRMLDEMAYRLMASITQKGYKAIYFPRDGYGDISVLVNKPEAAFSHVLAAKYAGLDTIGYNHTLLTKVFIVSLLRKTLDELYGKNLLIDFHLLFSPKSGCQSDFISKKQTICQLAIGTLPISPEITVVIKGNDPTSF
jgi:hypothetical protein